MLGALAVTAVLGFVLARRRGQFTAALHTAPVSLLALAAALQILALLARTEAWNVCVRAAGGTVTRRLLFRAAGVGYLASLVNGSVGMAVRIASLRRIAPQSTPRVPALVAAEVPIITVEVALAAIFSFTLIAPLGVPWWAPADRSREHGRGGGRAAAGLRAPSNRALGGTGDRAQTRPRPHDRVHACWPCARRSRATG